MGSLELLVSIISVVLGVLLLTRTEWSAPVKVFLSFLEIATLILSTVFLGLIGLAAAGGAFILTLLVISARLGMRHESILREARVVGGLDLGLDQLKALRSALSRSHKAFRVLGPIGTAELIRELAVRGRDASEIRVMARTIAMLWVIYRKPIPELVERFDRLLRLSGKTADDAEEVADQLVAASRASAATFDEMLDALLVVYAP